MPHKVHRINETHTPLLDAVAMKIQEEQAPVAATDGKRQLGDFERLEKVAPGLYREAGKNIWKVEEDESGDSWLTREEDLSIQEETVASLKEKSGV